MLKIPSLYVRDFSLDVPALNNVTPGCHWVFKEECTPYRKWDGTCCLVLNGRLWKRYDCKTGRTPPEDWEPIQGKPDDRGHWMGWAPLTEHDKWHWEAWQRKIEIPDPGGDIVMTGTYELCGPKVGGNPEGFESHVLIKHDSFPLRIGMFGYMEIWAYLDDLRYEGIVWHHPDGRMCKIKRSDFGLPWPLGER